jgi:hypothetical protein
LNIPAEIQTGIYIKVCLYADASKSLIKQIISETDWVNLITGTSDIHGAVSDFTSIFLKIAFREGR